MEYPNAWLAAMGTDEEHFASEARLASAMKLFEVGKFTSGQAAQFAGVSRVDFLQSCMEWGVNSVSWDEDDLSLEFSTPLTLPS